ncbi:MAG: thioredoxin [Acidimicrobiales bacterium]
MSDNGNVITVNDDDFDEQVTASEVPVLVDFWAAWCGPCKAVSPVLEEIAGERAGLRIAKLNVDDNPRTAQRYQVMSIPTLLLFKDGEAQRRIVGSRPKSQILSEVEPFLA